MGNDINLCYDNSKANTMSDLSYIYDLDDHPPLRYALLYGLQWAFVVFPAFIITAALVAPPLGLGPESTIRFLQLTLFVSGLFTIIQTLWGHRFPLVEGPSTALVLTFIILAPHGLPTLQGGMILGGALLVLAVLSGQLERITVLFTPNVVGVILMLIAFGLLPPLLRFLSGIDQSHPQGQGLIFAISIGLILSIATLSYWLRGIWKTLSLLLGMIAGSLLFYFLGRLEFQELIEAPLFSFSARGISFPPSLDFATALAFGFAYLAVMVNSLGSLQGIAGITDGVRLPGATRRGIFLNGLSGICCGLLGVVGTVSYSTGPGLVLVNRVASRFTVTYCGLIILAAAFLPKLAALLALVPAPVVGAALCIAMGAQVGAGITIISSRRIRSRDYFVTGLPLLLGTLVGFLPPGLIDDLPGPFRVFFANGLVTGIVMVMILEHLLLRDRERGRLPGK
ncbi:MAG: purine/pyrimidine permease [Deltaproteobacteria bacterium]|nr:purine/pyrimidine permease [Deltaproteobacteria bacterium]MBW2017275.1 purine/pyrimidine permease [Deltaproteobacteria bacterium]MBW2304793.1 purine/pyrimidine permease [Deltaproteobacteria bacterium]